LDAVANISFYPTGAGVQCRYNKTKDLHEFIHAKFSKNQNQSFLIKSSGSEIPFIHSTEQKTSSSRIEEHHFLTALFLSVYSFLIPAYTGRILRFNGDLHIPIKGLQLIYPHHYFW
jgi:hypothetical protein